MPHVLTPPDLMLIRGALQFWAEEIEPHGPEAGQAYLPASQPVTAELQRYLKNARLRYLLCNRTDMQPAKSRLSDDAADFKDADAILATVLLPPQ
ncbi:hypothetical protein [Rubinisphaera brasiliensis]|uniref:Uncharacterized protein n=1 Tax=Rubinisphaera brasiliensis (strain ATCC 49424 / DSM 5305 / JCM 21570 / IAM 15109 / NBRC 103401 / IFAM 1448) TaxID=756272 RepID=F0SHC3_RUBBR|nr:hypothetical protein [Rubinisphaera brasiliensis]ADY61678.1 hypothetical protein Plabr_4101 [Rubinisphaera brasiliensis DSM 5305]